MLMSWHVHCLFVKKKEVLKRNINHRSWLECSHSNMAHNFVILMFWGFWEKEQDFGEVYVWLMGFVLRVVLWSRTSSGLHTPPWRIFIICHIYPRSLSKKGGYFVGHCHHAKGESKSQLLLPRLSRIEIQSVSQYHIEGHWNGGWGPVSYNVRSSGVERSSSRSLGWGQGMMLLT